MGLRWRLALLIGAQAVHSIEEIIGQLWEINPMARLVASSISADLARGFTIANAGIVAFGVWCVAWPVWRQWPIAASLAWFWVVLESLNAIGHALWSLFLARYTAGVATAPLLLLSALYLARQLRSAGQRLGSRQQR